MSPTERTLRYLRKRGFTCEVVERRIPHTFVTKDLFGCIDIVAIHPELPGVMGLQVTSAAHMQERLRKVQAEDRAYLWMKCGNSILVVGWSKQGAAGKRKLWTPTIVPVSGGNISAELYLKAKQGAA